MAYIATYAARRGFNVGILHAEANGILVADVLRTVNEPVRQTADPAVAEARP